MSPAPKPGTAMSPLPLLRDDRVELRLGEAPDVPRIVAHLVENRAFLEPFEPEKPRGYFTEPFWKRQLELVHEEFALERSVRMFIFAKGGKPGAQRVLGTVNFTNIVRGAFHACHLGYGLAEREQGKGIMSASLRLAITYMFRERNMHRIMANYLPENERSGRLLRHLGFETEGEAKSYLLIAGQWRDHVLTSLINPNWKR